MILGSELELKKVQTAVSKHLGILLKIRGRGNGAKVWINTASSETIIVLWLLDLHLCGSSVKYLFFVCLVISLPRFQQLHLKYIFYIFLTFCSG